MRDTLFVEPTFVSFLKLHSTKKIIGASLIISFLLFSIGRLLMPIPNYYYDSFKYIECAKNNIIVSIRPTTYSRIITFFKHFSSSDIALIIAQYTCNYVANLFLFLTAIHFFKLKKLSKRLLFMVLFFNPLYFITSNIILSDSLFCGLSVIWVTLLFWIIRFPKWYFFVAQTLLLILLFKLRYHGIIFPIILFITLLIFIKINTSAKIIIISINCFILFVVINDIKNTNEKIVGVKTFSAFGGWQMASNALYILQNTNHQIDTNTMTNADADTKKIALFVKHYYDSNKNPIKTYLPRGLFLWDKNSPLNLYLEQYMKENHIPPSIAWQTLGEPYSKFGRYVILHNPVGYCKYWMLPNFLFYFASSPEAYLYYCNNSDTIPKIVVDYYHYSTNKVSPKTIKIYALIPTPMRYINTLCNVLFIVLALFYLKIVGWQQPNFFTKALLLFGIIYIVNLTFIVALAPTVVRYHLFILTLIFPFLIGITDFLITKFISKRA